MKSSLRHSFTLLVCGSLGASVLHTAGRGELAPPENWSTAALRALLEERGPFLMALGVVRYVALGACLYLAVLAALGLAARVPSLHWLAEVQRVVTPRVLRPFLGIVALATLSAPGAAYAAEGSSSPPIMVQVTPSSAPAPSSTTPFAGGASTATSPPPVIRRIDSPAPVMTTTTTAPAEATTTTTIGVVTTVTMAIAAVTPPPSAGMTTPTSPASAPTWTVERGDHLWHIAESTLTTALGRTPSEAEVTVYWRAVVEANRGRLADPSNPDLVFRGQEVTLPEINQARS